MFLTQAKCEELEARILKEIDEIPNKDGLDANIKFVQKVALNTAIKVLLEYERMKDGARISSD